MYWSTLYSFLIFLILFSTFILFNFCNRATFIEWSLLVWIMSLFLDEVRQIIEAPTRNGVNNLAWKGFCKIRSWWYNSGWNSLDISYITLFLLAFITKNLYALKDSQTVMVSDTVYFAIVMNDLVGNKNSIFFKFKLV